MSDFDRDWTVRPGATLKEWREENKLPVKAMARLCSMSVEQYEGVEAGRRKVTQVVACKLAQGTGIPPRLWLRFEAMYREDLAHGRKDVDG